MNAKTVFRSLSMKQKKKRQDDQSLKGREATTVPYKKTKKNHESWWFVSMSYWLTPFACEDYQQPGARIRDMTEHLPKVFNSMDNYFFMLIHVGANDAVEKIYNYITMDTKISENFRKGLGVSVDILIYPSSHCTKKE